MAGKDYRTKGTYGLGGQVRIANKNSHVDYDYGAYDSFDDIPQSLYDTVQIGKTIGIVTDGKIKEYWWQKQKDGTLGWVVKATDEERVIELINKYGTQGEQTDDVELPSDVIYVETENDLANIESPSEDALYIAEDTGYFYKYRDGQFQLIDDSEENGVIYCNGSFTNLENKLKEYTSTCTYDVVLVQSSNQIATYRFVCSSNGKKINQTLTKDQRDGTDANIRTRTGTIKTTNGVQSITWGSWTTRTPIYKEKLDTALSASSTNAVRNSIIKAALDNKATLNHTHNISDIHDDDDEELVIADESDEVAELVFPIESETLQSIARGEYESEDTEMFSGASSIRPMTSAEVQSLVQITIAAFNDAREKSE